ncbi:MAG: hypothetical protein H0T51_08105 [Pirellulales bacterium]|nr:hypothetical protein [Pirellulales bacterium]
MQKLLSDTIDTFTHHTIGGGPIAFSNLGGLPTIDSNDFFAPDLTLNSDIVLNANVTARTTYGTGTFSTIYLNGAISGAGGLESVGGGDLRMGGMTANTYAGLTKMSGGVLYLAKPASVVAVPGDLSIGSQGGTRDRGGEVHILNDNQIATTATVTLGRSILFVEGGDQSLSNLRFTGVNDPVLNRIGGSVTISPSQTLTITGGITRTAPTPIPSFIPSTSIISGGTLDLDGGLRPFQVDNIMPVLPPRR